MDENRVQAYLQLINALLNCPGGEEPQILQANSELLDLGFVQVCEAVAAQFAEGGRENEANFLRSVAGQLGEFLGINDEGDSDNWEEENTDKYVDFILGLLQAEQDSNSNIAVVYPILDRRKHLLNGRFAEILQQVAKNLIAEHPEDTGEIVGIIENLSIHIYQFPRGNRANNIEIAIAGYHIVLNHRQPGSEKWALTQNNLAAAYWSKITDNRAENIDRAIESYQLALQVYTREDFPEQWAATQHNLANAYKDKITGNRAENIDRAIESYQLALQVHTREDLPQYWAMTQNNLGAAYKDKITGNRAENLDRALESYQLALQVRTRKDFPEDWALTQNNLAAAYWSKITDNRAENIDRAIESYQLALQVYTREDFPEQWAATQHNLANAYKDKITGNRAENIDRALESYQLALQVYTREDFPENWAITQHNLATAYFNKIIGNRAENIDRAIESYQLALQVYTREDFPENWAGIQNNLGAAYKDKITGNRAENIDRALESYQLALQVYTREDFPEYWAMTQHNLATAYFNKITGNRAENIDRALEYSQLALQVYTREDFPEYWAMTQNSLATAYFKKITGNRAENIDRAIEYYQLALQVRTREDFPQNWAMTQNNMANAYSEKITGNRAENIDRAIECYKKALSIRTREAFPRNHTETLFNLGILYQNNQQWQLAYDTFSPAIETVEFLRGEIQSGDEIKQKLAEEWNKLYLGMVEVCIQMQRYTEAVEYAERSKAQNLIELLSVKDLYPQGEIPGEVRQELQQLRQRIAEENQRLRQAEEKDYATINQLRQDLAAKYPYTPLNFGEIHQLADEKAAIVEWYILGSSFCAFIITKNNSQPQFLSFPESDLDRLIDWVREYLTGYYSNREEWQNSLEIKLANLAEILHIDDIVNSIPKTCNKLILIPHRFLHLFPLHALPVSGENWQRFHSDNETCPLNPYLIDCFDNGVSYAPSCQILHQVQKYQRGKFDKLFAIQDPKNDLMAADMEVETIKNIFPKPEILAKNNAKKGEKSEEKLEIAERVAHSHHLFFSCHGSFNPIEPLQSGLKLADGTLTLEEIIGYFNLSECSLVTLSACETGQVRLDNTDEYISLTSGFMLAGSPSLYVTLWSVDAFSTAMLLIKTYENLYQKPGKLALALNQAQIWLRDTDIQGFLDWTNKCPLLDGNWRQILQYSLEDDKATQGANAKIYQNPFYWAGFCMAGKGEQNMANSISKLEVFQQLIQEADVFVNLRDDLISLKDKLTENDEENIQIIEKWLEDKPTIETKYKAKCMKLGDKSPRDATSSTKPGEKSEILIKSIENLTAPAEKTPERDEKTSL